MYSDHRKVLRLHIKGTKAIYTTDIINFRPIFLRSQIGFYVLPIAC